MSVDIIHDFVRYQIEWLTSHNDLEFEPVIEDAIVQMLKDTGKSFIYEQTAETSQIDHNADSSKMVCVDAISRQAAIDCVTYDVEYTIECLKALSSAQPETHWISCSKRLPEDGRCLVTRYDSVTNTCFSDILWYEKGVWWNRLCIGDFAVIAWMPLPASYKGE